MDIDGARWAHSVSKPYDVTVTSHRTNTITFRELAKRFTKAKRGINTDETLYILGTYLDSQLLPAFGPKRVNKITTIDVVNWFEFYSQSRPGGANQALGHFRNFIAWGKRYGHLPSDMPDPSAPLRLNKRKARWRLLNSQQLADLSSVLGVAGGRQRQGADAIRLILLTGCRSGEILRLTWPEVKKTELRLKQTKTGSRVVRLSSVAIEHIETLRLRRTSHFVFPSPIDPNKSQCSVDYVWRTLKNKAGLPSDIRLHDLRHTYASHAIMNGETLYMTGKLLGHHSPKSAEVYAHLDAKHLLKAARKVSNKIEELMG